MPRFRTCPFGGGYPFGRVLLDDEMPIEVHIKAFNPMVPADVDASSIPVAALTYELRNQTERPLRTAVVGVVPNFIGMDGWETVRDWKGDREPTGAAANTNRYRDAGGVRGLFMESRGVTAHAPQWGTLALVTTAHEGITYRTDWIEAQWGNSILDFWDDFSTAGRLDERPKSGTSPTAIAGPGPRQNGPRTTSSATTTRRNMPMRGTSPSAPRRPCRCSRSARRDSYEHFSKAICPTR